MTSALLSDADVCKYCGKPSTSTLRQYLTLESLCLHELPPHADLTQYKSSQEPTLAGFLNAALAEAYQIDFDDHTWSHHGKVPPPDRRIKVSMPPLRPSSEFAGAIDAPIEVDKRVKGKTSSAFLARRSCHNVRDVDYQELDTALAQDHCRKEADYDPSIFHGNELLKWDAEELQRVVAGLKPEWRVTGVQMSIFEMFHEMPKIMGKSLLKDRVFHVLCMTAHSSYHLSGTANGQTSLHTQSHTIQLPINIHTFQEAQPIISRSRFQPTSKTYSIRDATQSTERQKNHNGNKTIEGIYCSLERLRHAPGASDPPDQNHCWDMMTRSDAKGSTRFAPWSTKRKETLEAIAKDVQYVLEYIRKQRLAAKDVGH